MKNSSGEREKMTLNETAMEQMFAGELTTDVNLDNGNAIVGSHNSGTNINIGGRKQNV
jgi:hypothetical protein